MKTPDGLKALDIWSRCVGFPSATAVRAAAALLLSAAYPEVPLERLQDFTVGERDTLLLNLQEVMFGSRLEGVAACPHCKESLEFSLTVNDIRTAPKLLDVTGMGQNTPQSLVLGEYRVEFRTPTIADTQFAVSLEQLLDRCVLTASKAGVAQKAAELPQDVVEAISSHMASVDPQADVQLALTCPACTKEWQAPFDIASFLWDELNTWAQRTLLEVHQLASAYGWSEAEILALSPTRRQIYLSMIKAG